MDGVAEKVGVWSSHVTDSIPAPAHAQSGRADRSPVSTVLIGLTDPRPSHPVSPGGGGAGFSVSIGIGINSPQR